MCHLKKIPHKKGLGYVGKVPIVEEWVLLYTRFLLEAVGIVDRMTFQQDVVQDFRKFCDNISLISAVRYLICTMFWKLKLFPSLSNHVHGAVLFGIPSRSVKKLLAYYVI
jgi:hypothetical protein